MVDELTKALLLEQAAPPRAIAEALFASVTGGVNLLQALIDAGAASPEVLARVLARSDAPFLRQVVPVPELVERLPRGLCARLLAVPIRFDAITGTVDVAVADPADPHAAREVGFHLGAPVRVVRAPLPALEEALRRSRMRAREPRDRPDAEVATHGAAGARSTTLPPPEPALSSAMPSPSELAPRRRNLVVADSEPPDAPRPARIRTPPWGTPIHAATPRLSSAPPANGYGSEIPIPLTRKTFGPGGVLDAVADAHPPADGPSTERRPFSVSGSGIPRPPPLPGAGAFAAYAPQLPFPEMSGVLGALRSATSRDEILELVLTGARTVAARVALFVVKRGGYLGWSGSPELADRAALQSVLIPLDAGSIFDRAVREDFYLGPIRHDEVHAPLVRVLESPSREVAAVPIRVSGKTAVIILADDLGDTMLGTRRLEQLARAAGEAFTRIVRTRR